MTTPPGIFEFDQATLMTSDDGSTFTGAIEDGWDINGNANGGYLLALAGAAMRTASGRSDPISITAHYLAPAPPMPITVATGVVKSGRQLTTMTGSMRGPDRELLRVIGSFGEVASSDDSAGGRFTYSHADPPALPPKEECVLRELHSGSVSMPLMSRLRVWLRPDDARFNDGIKTGRALIEGYFEFADGRPIDTLALLLAVDAFPPSVFNIDVPIGWVPTVELTAHIRGIPRPGPLMCRFHTEFIQNGFLQEDGEIWDGGGRLVAQSRQLALIPRTTP